MWREAVIAIVVCLSIFGGLLILTGCDESTTNNISMTGVQSPINTNHYYCDASNEGECR